MKTLNAFALFLALALPSRGQSLAAADTNVLENVKTKVSVNAGGGFIEMRRDGTPASYPKSARATVKLEGVLNGNPSTLSTTGAFVKLAGVPVFQTPEGLFFTYNSGRIRPCFPGETITPLKPTGNASTDLFLRAWLALQFRSMSESVQELSVEASKGDADALQILGTMLHPEAKRLLNKVASAPDQEISAAAKKALLAWEEIRLVVAPPQKP